MNKKKHHVSLRVSENDLRCLNAFKGKYSMSYAIRKLIREKPLERVKTGIEANKNPSLDQEERETFKWIESLV